MIPDSHILHHISVRRAAIEDVPTLLEIKRALAVEISSHDSFDGGFLLGSSEELYLALAQAGQILLVQHTDAGRVLGFGIGIESEILRASPLWERRDMIEWEPCFDAGAAMLGRVGYLDQLAIRPSAQRQWLGAVLGCSIMEHFVATRHDVVLTTTLIAPMKNTASIPLITRASGRLIGTLAEHYESVGDVVSAMHLIPPQGYAAMRDRTLVQGNAFEKEVLRLAAAPHSQ